MNSSQLKFWAFKENPYSNDITNISFFLKMYQYDETIKKMVMGVEELNLDITQIAGEVGTGKSFTCVMLTSIFRDKGYYVIYMQNPCDNYEILIRKIVSELTNQKPRDITDATMMFEDALERINSAGKQLIIIFDECHVYDDVTLDKIRLLSNYNAKASSRKLISLILVGQPELREKIRKMKQLYSRIKVKQYLNYLNESEMETYILHRLYVAGYSKKKANPFCEHIRQIYTATLGAPRAINNVCEKALEISADKKEKVISEETMKEAIAYYTEIYDEEESTDER